MRTVTIQTAKKTLSQLLARVEAGEEIILARGRKPIAKLVPVQPRVTKRQFGAMRGLIRVGSEFFDPLPEDELVEWENARRLTRLGDSEPDVTAAPRRRPRTT